MLCSCLEIRIFKKANKTHGFDTAVFPFSLTDLQSQRKEEKLLSLIIHFVLFMCISLISVQCKYLLHLEVSWFLFAALSVSVCVCVSEREEGVVEHNTEPSSRGRTEASIGLKTTPHYRTASAIKASQHVLQRETDANKPQISVSPSTGWHSVLMWIFSSSAVILCQSLNDTS